MEFLFAPSTASPPSRTTTWRVGISTLLVACVLGLGACSSTTTSTTTSTVHVSAKASITASWVEFFSGKTSAAQKTAALQNGGQFAQIIKGQANSALAKSVHAVVLSVNDIGATTASVRYSLYLGTTLALGDQIGRAIFQSGRWKVSDSSFCVLLGLEGVTTTACPKS